MAGIPICTVAGKGGGISLMSGYTFDKALLSDKEQDQVLFALQSLQAAGQGMDGLLSKLSGLFRREATDWIEVDFSRWGLARVDNKRFEVLKSCILGKTKLHISYCGASGTMSEREIEPFKLIFKDKNWYLQAFCLKAADYRLFKVNRIVELIPLSNHFTDTFADAPSIEQEIDPSPAVAVRLLFSPAVAFRVYDEFDHSSIEKQSDGSLLVHVCFPPGSWLISYLISFGTEVKILGQDNLKAEVVAYAKKIYEYYKS
jgi:predicted DNA-binding transcriptional regulator YafY